MPSLTCVLGSDCDKGADGTTWVSDILPFDQAKMLLDMHVAHIHGTVRTPSKQPKAETLSRPNLQMKDGEISEKDWDDFRQEWEVYKEQANLQEATKEHLQSCLGNEVIHIMLGRLGLAEWDRLTESTLMNKVKHMFLTQEDWVANRLKIHGMKQNPDEPVHQFVESLKEVARTCKYFRTCPNGACGSRIDFSDDIVLDHLVIGLKDNDIQKKVLCIEEADFNLEKVEQLVTVEESYKNIYNERKSPDDNLNKFSGSKSQGSMPGEEYIMDINTNNEKINNTCEGTKMVDTSPQFMEIEIENMTQNNISDQCEYKTNYERNFERYGKSILGNFTYSCDHCEYKATQKGNMKRHIESVHGNITYPCNQCQYKATQKTSLKTHIQSVHRNITYPCDQCEYKATLKSNLKKHIKSKHEQLVTADEISKNAYKKRKFSVGNLNKLQGRSPEKDNIINVNNTNKNIDKVHEGPETIDTSIECMEYEGENLNQNNIYDQFESKKKYKRSFARHCESILGKFIHSCDQCEYESSLQENLKKHIESTHTNITYSCNQREQKASFKSSLKYDIKSSHTNRGGKSKYKGKSKGSLKTYFTSVQSRHKNITFPCSHCGHEANSKQSLKYHIESRHALVIHSCNQCEFKTPVKRSFKYHMDSVHRNIYYPCYLCEYKYTQKGNLKQHIEHKHGNITYDCDQCEYKASQKCGLKTHIENIHGNITYPCHQCDHKATLKSNLKKHIEAMHENITYDCYQCEYKAGDKGSLKKHIESKHG